MKREYQNYGYLRQGPLGNVAWRIAQPWILAWNRARIRFRTKRRVHGTVHAAQLPEIAGSGDLALGKRVRLEVDLYFETCGKGKVSIGDRTRICRGCRIVSHSEVCIGRNTWIGEDTLIRDVEDPLGILSTSLTKGRRSAPISIGNNVLIGAGTTIMPGVRIGDGAVISPNAVVACDVPPGLVVGGIPAKPSLMPPASYRNRVEDGRSSEGIREGP